MRPRRFRIALSFAGEKRNFVAQIAATLAARFGEEQILYDKYHEAEFARRNLGIYLPELYHKQSDLVVVVICPDYSEKEWTGLEWAAIHDLLKARMDSEVMLCRFDHAQVAGLYSSAGFVELDDKNPEQTVMLILQRLALNEGKPKDYYAAGRAAPTATISTIANNLPRLAYFFGRATELAVIADALTPQRRTWGVLIDGPGGIGKTSLAIRAAELIADDQFDRILFLSAKEREMTADGQKKLTGFVVPGYLEMLNEIARQLKLKRFTQRPEAHRARVLLDALKDEHALLILDNLESLTPEHRGQLFTFLGNLPQGCKAIVTSRRRTDVDARIVRLEKMDPQAALDYLAELSESRPHLQKSSEAERRQLYEETGGNPLIIRWLVGQLGKGRCKTVDQALAFLRGAPRDNDPLEFIFGDLLETFSECEQNVVAALAYFSTPIDVKHVAELGGNSQTATRTALEDLSDRGLVVTDAEQQKFVLVALAAEFLRKYRPEVMRDTGNRLEQLAYALIVENGFQQHNRYSVLDAAWPTIDSALSLFIAGANARLQIICHALGFFLNFTGRWDERLLLNQHAEAKAVAAGDHDNAGWRAYEIGMVMSLRRQGDAVLECAKRASEHWKVASAGVRETAVAIQLRGRGHELNEDFPGAIAAFGEALDLFKTLSPEGEDVAMALNDLANAEGSAGDFDSAEGHAREALRVAQAAKDEEGVAIYTGNLAEITLQREKWAEAELLSREALRLAEDVGRRELIASNCNRLARALLENGRKDEAVIYARRAVEMFTHLGLSSQLEVARASLEEAES